MTESSYLIARCEISGHRYDLVRINAVEPYIVMDGPGGRREIAKSAAEIGIECDASGVAVSRIAAEDALYALARRDLDEHLAKVAAGALAVELARRDLAEIRQQWLSPIKASLAVDGRLSLNDVEVLLGEAYEDDIGPEGVMDNIRKLLQ